MVMRGIYCFEIAFAQSIVINKKTFQVVTTVKSSVFMKYRASGTAVNASA